MEKTKEYEIKLELENLFKRCAQLLNFRWQAIGIAITLISVFWIFAMQEIVKKTQEPSVMYLLIFVGVFFSIIILLVWRYIAHILADEESHYWDSIFINCKLLEGPYLISEEEIRNESARIQKKDLKIHNFRQCLSDEFNNFKDKRLNLNSLYDLLYDDENLILIEKKNVYYHRFNSGKWKFDLSSFILISIFYVIGLLAFVNIYDADSTNAFFKLFQSIKPLIVIIYVVIIVVLAHYLGYIIQNFNWINTQSRYDEIEKKIYSICPKEKLDSRKRT